MAWFYFLCHLEFYSIKQRESRLIFVRHSSKKAKGGEKRMADTTFTPKIVTDPHTLLSTTRAISERIAPQANLRGSYVCQLIEQLRLLFIDSHQALFVFGAPDKATLTNANIYARVALENALEEIFEEKIRLELVQFNEGEDPLPELIAGFTEQRVEAGQDEASQPLEASTVPVEVSEEETTVETEGGTPNLNKIQLGLIQNNLRGVFTSPKRVVVVPGYLLRWIPYIGPLRTSIVVACFQAFYLCKGTTARANLTFDAPGPFLAAIAGIAESSIWRHLDDPELGWFLKRVPYKPGEKQWIRDDRAGLTKKRPTRFLFRSTSPLTPGDAEALLTYLVDLDIQEDPVRVLTELVRGEYRVEPRDVFPFPAPPLPEDWRERDPDGCLIHNIIYSAMGIEAKSATKNLTDLVDELVERLLPANDQIHISWYYLLHWLPLLGHNPGWATILLRDRCFYNRQTGELRDTVSIRGGYQEFAGALGLQRIKTVREWFPAPHAQKGEQKSADLSSQEALEKIAQSKRSFVKEYAAKFVEITEADADGRGQVSSIKAQVKLFDPLTPAHEAAYNALYPLVQRYFSLPQEQQAAFLNAFEVISTTDASMIEWIIRESGKAAEEIIQKYGIPIQPGLPCELKDAAAADLLGAIERITEGNIGVNRRFTSNDPGADGRITTGDLGAFGGITTPELDGFEWITALISGAFGKIISIDSGAFERIGLVFWAYMRGLKHMVLNNHLDESLKEYFQNTDLQSTEKLTSITTTEGQDEASDDNHRAVDVEKYPIIEKWDLNRILNNFSPHVKRELLEKDVTVGAVVACLFYIASSKGDNLGLGYVVEKLKAHPQDGQGGIYRRLAEDPPEEVIDRLESYIEYRSFRNRDWRVAMGSPTTEKILELLEHLGIDSSRFGSREEWG